MCCPGPVYSTVPAWTSPGERSCWSGTTTATPPSLAYRFNASPRMRTVRTFTAFFLSSSSSLPLSLFSPPATDCLVDSDLSFYKRISKAIFLSFVHVICFFRTSVSLRLHRKRLLCIQHTHTFIQCTYCLTPSNPYCHGPLSWQAAGAI